jgi:hypothetical protein
LYRDPVLMQRGLATQNLLYPRSGIARGEPAPTVLTENASTTDGTSIATASISPVAGQPIYAAVASVRALGSVATPTCTGCGLTWTQVATITNLSTTLRRVTIFEAIGTPSAGALTFDFGGQTQDAFVWAVIQVAETKSSGFTRQSKTAAANAITSLTATFDAALEHRNNLCLGFVLTNDNPVQAIDHDADFTELTDRTITTNAVRLGTQWARNQTSCTPTWASATQAALVIVEVKAA